MSNPDVFSAIIFISLHYKTPIVAAAAAADMGFKEFIVNPLTPLLSQSTKSESFKVRSTHWNV